MQVILDSISLHGSGVVVKREGTSGGGNAGVLYGAPVIYGINSRHTRGDIPEETHQKYQIMQRMLDI
jgi:hypothetical protein